MSVSKAYNNFLKHYNDGQTKDKKSSWFEESKIKLVLNKYGLTEVDLNRLTKFLDHENMPENIKGIFSEIERAIKEDVHGFDFIIKFIELLIANVDYCFNSRNDFTPKEKDETEEALNIAEKCLALEIVTVIERFAKDGNKDELINNIKNLKRTYTQLEKCRQKLTKHANIDTKDSIKDKFLKQSIFEKNSDYKELVILIYEKEKTEKETAQSMGEVEKLNDIINIYNKLINKQLELISIKALYWIKRNNSKVDKINTIIQEHNKKEKDLKECISAQKEMLKNKLDLLEYHRDKKKEQAELDKKTLKELEEEFDKINEAALKEKQGKQSVEAELIDKRSKLEKALKEKKQKEEERRQEESRQKALKWEMAVKMWDLQEQMNEEWVINDPEGDGYCSPDEYCEHLYELKRNEEYEQDPKMKRRYSVLNKLNIEGLRQQLEENRRMT